MRRSAADVQMKNAYTIADGVATIELTQGQATVVSADDLPLIADFRWCARRGSRTWYAVTAVHLSDGRWTKFRAHRLLCGLGFGNPHEVDHIDGDGLNNLSSNLRVTDRAGNNHNQHGKQPRRRGEVPTSAHPGAFWDKAKSKWRAQITNCGVRIHLGYYDDEEDAAGAYLRAKSVRDAGGLNEEIQAAWRDR
jgi:hypothetical protein